MCPYMLLGFRQADLFPAQRDTFHQKRHIPCKHTHCLLSFFVHVRLSWFPPVDAVPVLAGSDWLIGDCKILIELVKCYRTATPYINIILKPPCSAFYNMQSHICRWFSCRHRPAPPHNSCYEFVPMLLYRHCQTPRSRHISVR